MTIRPSRMAFAAACLMLISPVLHAQTTFHWGNSIGGSYHSASNWSPGGGPPIFDDYARFNLPGTYTVSFANSGTQTIDFQVRSGNVTFAYLNPTAHHSWGSGGTNYVGPQAGDSATSATLNLTNMFNNPMMGHHLVIGNTAGKTGTLNIHSSGHWKGYASSDVFVGQAGAGNLNISTIGIAQNSILEARDVRIGQFGGTGTATVSGWNALMKVNDSLVLGTFENSVGKLVVSNQGLVTVGNALVVGFGSFGDNMITVTGSGSKMTLGAGNVVLGSQGKGTLRVQNGGLVVNTGGEVRLAAINNGNSIGSLEIDGSGSHFNSTSSGTTGRRRSTTTSRWRTT